MRSGVTLALALSGLVTLVSAPVAALADEPPPATVASTPKHDLDDADAAYANVDYEGAGTLARRALDQRGLSHDELVRGYRMLARVDAVLDRADESRAAFVMLLTLSPGEKDDKNLPPKMTDRLAEARGVVGAYAVHPGIEATAALKQREAGVVRVALHDPSHVVHHVRVAFRWSGEGAFAVRVRDAIDTLAIDVPPPPTGASRFDYYAEGLDDHDSIVFESGTPDAPRTTSLALVEIVAPPPPPRIVPIAPPPSETPSRSVFASPVFWAVAAGTLVAGGVILFAATRPGSASSASLSPALDCGGVRCN